MAQQYPPKKNDTAGYTLYLSLVSQADTKIFQANPTLAAGDAKIAIDDGAPANLATLPAVDADFTKRVKVVLSQAETNGDNLTLILSDAAGAEWCDLTINLQPVSERLQAIATETRLAELDGANLPADVGAIKVKTDNLPSDPADQSLVIAATDAITSSIAALNNLSQANIRTAIGLATANLDTQLDALPTTAENFVAVLTTQLTEAYATDGVAPTLAQAVFMILQLLSEFTISGTTITTKKLDGSTTAMVHTMDDATTPTSRTRSS